MVDLIFSYGKPGDLLFILVGMSFKFSATYMDYVICMCKIVKTNRKVEVYKALVDSFCFSGENVYFIVLDGYEMDNGMYLFYKYILPDCLCYSYRSYSIK